MIEERIGATENFSMIGKDTVRQVKDRIDTKKNIIFHFDNSATASKKYLATVEKILMILMKMNHLM